VIQEIEDSERQRVLPEDGGWDDEDDEWTVKSYESESESLFLEPEEKEWDSPGNDLFLRLTPAKAGSKGEPRFSTSFEEFHKSQRKPPHAHFLHPGPSPIVAPVRGRAGSAGGADPGSQIRAPKGYSRERLQSLQKGCQRLAAEIAELRRTPITIALSHPRALCLQKYGDAFPL
jgi:hypothetical protein